MTLAMNLAMNLVALLFVFFTTSSYFSLSASADDFLPYYVRSSPYSGIQSGVRGDIRTVGMAGATVGLGDTFMASSDNPAGLAMTMKNGDTNFTSNTVYDQNIQTQAIYSNSLGVALNSYPWGFSVGKAETYDEGGTYRLTTAILEPIALDINTSEYRLSAGRVFFERFAFGASLRLGVLDESMAFSQEPQYNMDRTSAAVSATFGGMARLSHRMVLGVSYSLPMTYQMDPNLNPSVRLSGFFQSVEVPYRIGTGLGWIPNRFFRADFTTYVIGSTYGAALLRDQSVGVDQKVTLQPRLGAAYVFADFRSVKGTVFAGTYFETSRVDRATARSHLTSGIETKFWMVNIGFAIDGSAGYRNYLAGIGIDPFALMTKLHVIPKTDNEALGGLMPPIFQETEEGLSRSMQDNWDPNGPSVDPVAIGLKIPENLKNVGPSLLDGIQSFPSIFGDEFESMQKIESDKYKKNQTPLGDEEKGP